MQNKIRLKDVKRRVNKVQTHGDRPNHMSSECSKELNVQCSVLLHYLLLSFRNRFASLCYTSLGKTSHCFASVNSVYANHRSDFVETKLQYGDSAPSTLIFNFEAPFKTFHSAGLTHTSIAMAYCK